MIVFLVLKKLKAFRMSVPSLIPVCQDLKPFQRIMPGIILCNAQLIFMMMAKAYVQTIVPGSLNVVAAGFIALVLVLTVNFMFICYQERKPKK